MVAIVELVPGRNEELERGRNGSWGDQFMVHSIKMTGGYSARTVDRYFEG